MPSRQISPQSFDEILSELGDDPAIPDPHGIRKTTAPKTQPKRETPAPIPTLADLKKVGLLIALGVGVIGFGFALFTTYDSMKVSQNLDLEYAQKEIVGLKKELASLRDEILAIEDEIYESIDSIEVSIHSLNKNSPSSAKKLQAQVIPFEAELRRWRYLGLSQISGSQQAFFHNGKATVMLEKGSSALGEWRLNNADKELATLTHSQGKSLTLRPSKTE
jgi:hypothetical protein